MLQSDLHGVTTRTNTGTFILEHSEHQQHDPRPFLRESDFSQTTIHLPPAIWTLLLHTPHIFPRDLPCEPESSLTSHLLACVSDRGLH